MAIRKTKKTATVEVDLAVENAVIVGAQPKDEVKGEKIVIGDYTISLESTDSYATAQVVSSAGAIAAEVESLAVDLEEISGWIPRLLPEEAVKWKALREYHKVVDLEDGLVDVACLAEHPYNALIYGAGEKLGDLVKLLERPGAEVYEVLYDKDWGLVSGNRRVKAAKIVNEKAIAKGQLPPFEHVKVKFVSFASLAEEVEYMVLQNAGREKSPQQRKNEAKTLLARIAEKAAVPEENKRGANKEMMSQIQSLTGLSRSAAFVARQCQQQIEAYQDEGLKASLRDYAISSPVRCKEILDAHLPKNLQSVIDLEGYHKELLKEATENPKNAVSKAIAFTNRKFLESKTSDPNPSPVSDFSLSSSLDSTSTPPVEEGLEEIFEKMLGLGDKPSDNRKTPEEVIQLAKAVMGEIALDAFAMATDPHRICDRGYTVFDDAFKQEDFAGNVFANPPFSRASEAIDLLFGAIAKGQTEQLFLILPSSVLSSKSYHNALKNFNPIVFNPSKRIEFEMGELLADSGGKDTSNREPSVILYWSKTGFYKPVADICQNRGWVGRRYEQPTIYDLISLSVVDWEAKPDNVYAAEFFGVSLAVGLENNGNKNAYWVKVGEDVLPVSVPLKYAQQLAIASAMESLSF